MATKIILILGQQQWKEAKDDVEIDSVDNDDGGGEDYVEATRDKGEEESEGDDVEHEDKSIVAAIW